MRKLLFLILLLSFAPANAKDINWYRIAANAAISVDWLQTRYIAKHDAYTELNPVLGPNPSINKVDLYFATSLLYANVVGEWLPVSWSDHYYFGLSLWEAGVVTRNHNIGVGIYMGF